MEQDELEFQRVIEVLQFSQIHENVIIFSFGNL